MIVFLTIVCVLIFFMLLGIRIIRPVEQGVVETLGKFSSIRMQGFHWIIPIIQKMRRVNITERMVDVDEQTVITKDKLNVIVDAIVYYKVNDVKKSLYNVDNHEIQLVSLARTTLRAVIGKLTLTQANEDRDNINASVEAILDKETKDYGVEVLRVEIQKVEAPEDVQEAMNEVVKAEQKKIAAMDLATAIETEADGKKRASIKEAEGQAQSKILVAEATATSIKIVNESAEKYFKGNAQKLKQLEVLENSLKSNSKIILGGDNKGILKLFDLDQK